MVVLVSDHCLPPRPNLQSGRPNIIIFLYTNNQSYTFPISTLRTQPTSRKGKNHQSWTPSSAMTHTTKLAMAGQVHFIDFSSYRWGESHSPCFHLKPETCVSTPKLFSFRTTLKSVSKCSID